MTGCQYFVCIYVVVLRDHVDSNPCLKFVLKFLISTGKLYIALWEHNICAAVYLLLCSSFPCFKEIPRFLASWNDLSCCRSFSKVYIIRNEPIKVDSMVHVLNFHYVIVERQSFGSEDRGTRQICFPIYCLFPRGHVIARRLTTGETG